MPTLINKDPANNKNAVELSFNIPIAGVGTPNATVVKVTVGKYLQILPIAPTPIPANLRGLFRVLSMNGYTIKAISATAIQYNNHAPVATNIVIPPPPVGKQPVTSPISFDLGTEVWIDFVSGTSPAVAHADAISFIVELNKPSRPKPKPKPEKCCGDRDEDDDELGWIEE